MPSRRVLKAAEAIREVVAISILADLKDPRIQNVTVTFVEVAGDMRQAKVHVSIMGTDSEQQLCLHGLQSSAGFLQKKIANRIDTRYTPRLEFVIDEGVKKSIEIARILKEILPENSAAESGTAGATGGSNMPLAQAAAEAEMSEAIVEDSDEDGWDEDEEDAEEWTEDDENIVAEEEKTDH